MIARSYSGPAFFSYGFRTFFLSAAVWAAVAMLLWLLQFDGEMALPTTLAPRDWHIHEMLYGYVTAIVAGFLLTAIPNWTGRAPIAGWPLVGLFCLWLAGRIAMLSSAAIGIVAAGIIDSSFLIALAAVASREIFAARKWRAARVLAVLSFLVAGNLLFHIEVAVRGAADYGTRVGIAAAVGLVMLIGGRIVPSFTRDWLMLQSLGRKDPGRLPRPFAQFDAASMVIGLGALAAWIVRPGSTITGGLLVAAAVLHLIRAARWAGDRTTADRIVLILHVGYVFVPIGFLLTGLGSLWPERIAMSAGIHAWTVGAIAIMSFAVMTRVSLGHTGGKVVASRVTEAMYALAIIAAVTRVAASTAHSDIWLHVAALAWTAAFGGFAIVYGPRLVRASRSPKSGC